MLAKKSLTRKAKSDNRVKSLSKILSNTLLPAYIAISLLSLSNCAKPDNSTASDRLNFAKQQTASLLMQKFDAEIFDASSKVILNRPVVLDSTLIGIIENKGQYFLRAEVKLKGSKKYFAELKCSRQIADSYYRTKSNSALIAAKISRIDDCSTFAESDSLDGSKSQLNLGKSTLLSGECLALVEIPSILNAD